ncbi:hypothetical protein WME99_22855 [Sorangium sp. So ce136]|uniref:hypothetical protein n=1 Tax=Sorangium sp. So ce136 TaxID=3133284 RepID=UPI003F07E4C1
MTTSRLLNHRFVAIGYFAFSSSALALLGCVGEAPVDSGVPEDVSDTQLSFEEFVASTYQERDTGLYIVDGDTPIDSLDELKKFYERHLLHGALIVDQSGGVDDKWNDTQKLSITYCVSTSFGGNHGAVVAAMASATAAWEGAAYVNFDYRSDQDSSCNASNNNVVFDVRPVSAQPYLARAFFPNYARSNRNVLIDSTSFGTIAPYTLAGILRHELGHTLGFRHEHTRPEAGTCFEDSSWRALTTYDSASVMHYPQCNGTNTGDLNLTTRDINGAAALYGARWESLGGTLTSSPAVSSWGSGRLDVFARGADNALWHKWFQGSWSGWESLGGSITSDPAAVSWSNGRIDVFARGTDNSLQHKWFQGGWSTWESLGGTLTSGPAVSSWGSGRLDVFARGTDNSLQHKSFQSSWSAWESLGGSLTSDPAAVSWSNGRIDVFARGTDNGLTHKYFQGSWSSWESLGGVLTSAPGVSSWGSGRLDVFARGGDNALWHKWYQGGWADWEWLGGNLTASPDAVSWGNGRIDVFARGTDNSLTHSWFDGTW